MKVKREVKSYSSFESTELRVERIGSNRRRVGAEDGGRGKLGGEAAWGPVRARARHQSSWVTIVRCGVQLQSGSSRGVRGGRDGEMEREKGK
ncbi:hypothetical protein Csa_017121 [Cucumis sativus]|uniref:Uncharacterized protein n=1 Tax=Cucumis sativus TaxID=3659 RepID=A0A0A0K2I6_CUCSA|nr:hypothetical protein Csa_017121 [Cucumis sativus]